MAAAAVNFALAPGVLEQDEILDYSQVNAIKHYKSATHPIDECFDVDPAGLKVFLASVRIRCDEFSMNDVINVPTDIAFPNVDRLLLLDNYAQLSVDQITDWADTYIGTDSRLAQDNAMLYAFLSKSLTNKGLKKVMLKTDSYTIDGDKVASLFLKTICDEAHVSTNASCRQIRQSFGLLSEKIEELGWNIAKFNEYVEDSIDTLHAHGQEPGPDLLNQLFTAYKAVPDTNFNRWIVRREDDFDDGTTITHLQLLTASAIKYNTLVDEKKWNTPTEDQKKIIAMEAKLEKIQKSRAKGGPTSTIGSGTVSRNNNRDTPAWMLIAPTDGSLTMTRDGKPFKWCNYHKKWCNHFESNCNKKAQDEARRTPSADTAPATTAHTASNNSANSAPRLRINAALTTVQEGADDEDLHE